MDSESIKTGLMVVNTVGNFAIGIWLYLERRGDKTNDRITATNDSIDKLKGEVDARLDRHSTQLAHLEAQAEGAPTHADLSQLHEKVNAIATSQGRIEGTVAGISDTLRLILSRITEKGMP
jgi:hypothetical protein